MKPTCGAPTRQGTPCRYDLGACPWHPPPAPSPPGDSAEGERRAPKLPPDGRSLEDAIERRDLHAVAWSLLASEVSADARPNPALLSTLLRVLASLGAPPPDAQAALAEAELRGLVMSGLALDSDDQRSLALELFGEEALRLLEGEVSD